MYGLQNFQFKLLCRLRVFPSSSKIKLDNPVKLVATASKYGLTFVGSPSGVQCEFSYPNPLKNDLMK
jgi:hypothetical protein